MSRTRPGERPAISSAVPDTGPTRPHRRPPVSSPVSSLCGLFNATHSGCATGRGPLAQPTLKALKNTRPHCAPRPPRQIPCRPAAAVTSAVSPTAQSLAAHTPAALGGQQTRIPSAGRTTTPYNTRPRIRTPRQTHQQLEPLQSIRSAAPVPCPAPSSRLPKEPSRRTPLPATPAARSASRKVTCSGLRASCRPNLPCQTARSDRGLIACYRVSGTPSLSPSTMGARMCWPAMLRRPSSSGSPPPLAGTGATSSTRASRHRRVASSATRAPTSTPAGRWQNSVPPSAATPTMSASAVSSPNCPPRAAIFGVIGPRRGRRRTVWCEAVAPSDTRMADLPERNAAQHRTGSLDRHLRARHLTRGAEKACLVLEHLRRTLDCRILTSYIIWPGHRRRPDCNWLMVRQDSSPVAAVAGDVLTSAPPTFDQLTA